MNQSRSRVDIRRFHSSPLWVGLLVLLLAASAAVRVQAAHSSRRQPATRRGVEPRYDRSITTFSSDGRLAQVEYGMEASLRGSTVAAVRLEGDNNAAGGICVVVQNSSFGKVHRIDHHLWLVTAGLSGDARALAQSLRASVQNHRLSYGEAPTTQQVARMAGQAQHELTRTGGARPLGCTALVLGIDPSSSFSSSSSLSSDVNDTDKDKDSTISTDTAKTTKTKSLGGKPRLFQTDPGGIVEESSVCAAGKGRVTVGKDLGTLVANTNEFSGKSLTTAAADIAELVLGKLDDSKGRPSVVDVWTIQPNANRRGGMQATCYRNIDKDSVSRIIRDQPILS